MENHRPKLDVLALGFAFGILWGVGMLLMGWMAYGFGWGAQLVEAFGSLYIGYAPTFWGSVIGGLWAFLDGFVGGLVFAWLYNLFLRRKT